MHACARLWLWQVPLASSPIPTIVEALCDEHDNPTSHTIFKSEQACHTLGLVVELDLVDDLVILGATPPIVLATTGTAETACTNSTYLQKNIDTQHFHVPYDSAACVHTVARFSRRAMRATEFA